MRISDNMRFPKEAHISARIHESEKEKLKRTGYNVREAIEYFNRIANNKVESLKIEEFFLNREIEDLRDLLIIKERKLDRIQQEINEHHIERVSALRVDSYQKIIELYNRDRTNQSFEDFVGGSYIREKFISMEVVKFPECDMESFCSDMLDYYNDVIIVGH